MDTVMGIVLGGTILFTIFMYVVMMILLGAKAIKGNLKSDSRGTKNLRFQEWNHTWQRFVTRK